MSAACGRDKERTSLSGAGSLINTKYWMFFKMILSIWSRKGGYCDDECLWAYLVMRLPPNTDHCTFPNYFFHQVFSFSFLSSLAASLLCEKRLNIARIAKRALHKLPGMSSLKVKSLCPVSPLWLVCPVCAVYPGCPGWPVCPDGHNNHPVYPPCPVWPASRGSCEMSPQMTCLKSLNAL